MDQSEAAYSAYLEAMAFIRSCEHLLSPGGYAGLLTLIEQTMQHELLPMRQAHPKEMAALLNSIKEPEKPTGDSV